MKIEEIKKNISKLNLEKWKLVQTNLSSLVIFKTKYKYTDCIYINLDKNGANIKKERIFDNKYLNLSVKRLLISKVYIEENNLNEYIKKLLKCEKVVTN